MSHQMNPQGTLLLCRLVKYLAEKGYPKYVEMWREYGDAFEVMMAGLEDDGEDIET